LAHVTLDLRNNRWGDVTSAAELDELMEFQFNGASVLEILTSPVAVLPFNGVGGSLFIDLGPHAAWKLEHMRLRRSTEEIA